ncbi:hypothetical protein I7I51_03861 [Histoplasma capsulatum]|uniref:Uncharacterized protein n=1 Tax=Ajellomyces capsulatus TaxID=5037 RepID=A0A8A1MAP5_AJECA|nr:predicted protein [Histoplasma mississippiense (nom. inval.)]EDN08186.1 predicted protein [Histoplasma mississippiense (nom. inval.)]QSS61684.1 hypothetical protein I7I51_03861 [Histoplasma capsulatum]
MIQEPKRVQPLDMRPDSSKDSELLQQARERRDRIVAVYSKIYGIAKFVFIILMAYGVELDDAHSGIKFHIEQVEDQMAQDSNAQLLQTIEDLFYALYARLNIEITNVQLSESFRRDNDGGTTRMGQNNYRSVSSAGQYLPGPSNVSMIFQACKRLLTSEDICNILDQELICMKQASYVQNAVEAFVANDSDGYCHRDDVLEYRRHVEMIVFDPNSPFARELIGLNPIYKEAPCMVLAMLSEKYLGFQRPADRNDDSSNIHYEYAAVEMARPTPIPPPTAIIAISRQNSVASSSTSSSASSAATLSMHRLLPERRRTEANREAAYAMLNGISVGEYRRTEGKRALRQYVRDQLCICFGYCSCARKCTLKFARTCPCSARMSVLCDVEVAGQYYGPPWLDEEGLAQGQGHREQQAVVIMDPTENFSRRCAQLGCALFAGLCSVRKGVVLSFFEVYMEVKAGAEVFHQEALAYREIMGVV